VRERERERESERPKGPTAWIRGFPPVFVRESVCTYERESERERERERGRETQGYVRIRGGFPHVFVSEGMGVRGK